MSDVKNIRPTLPKVFDEFITVIEWCGKQENQYGFPAALLAFSLIQAIGLYLDGRIGAEYNKPQFYDALKKYLPGEYSVRETLWKKARNCLAHDLTVCGGVGISWDQTCKDLHLHEDGQGNLVVSMIKLTETLRKATRCYLQDLDQNPTLQATFRKVVGMLEKS